MCVGAVAVALPAGRLGPVLGVRQLRAAGTDGEGPHVCAAGQRARGTRQQQRMPGRIQRPAGVLLVCRLGALALAGWWMAFAQGSAAARAFSTAHKAGGHQHWTAFKQAALAEDSLSHCVGFMFPCRCMRCSWTTSCSSRTCRSWTWWPTMRLAASGAAASGPAVIEAPGTLAAAAD